MGYTVSRKGIMVPVEFAPIFVTHQMDEFAILVGFGATKSLFALWDPAGVTAEIALHSLEVSGDLGW